MWGASLLFSLVISLQGLQIYGWTSKHGDFEGFYTYDIPYYEWPNGKVLYRFSDKLKASSTKKTVFGVMAKLQERLPCITFESVDQEENGHFISIKQLHEKDYTGAKFGITLNHYANKDKEIVWDGLVTFLGMADHNNGYSSLSVEGELRLALLYNCTLSEEQVEEYIESIDGVMEYTFNAYRNNLTSERYEPKPGMPGILGIPGDKGATGDEGARVPGPEGRTGDDGEEGEPGASCFDRGLKSWDIFELVDSDCDDGLVKHGLPGFPGRKGARGEPGVYGLDGRPGYPGLPGLYGPEGLPGIKGEKGDRGNEGSKGMPGYKGDMGDSVDQDCDEIDYEEVCPGMVGPPGVPGAKGEKGYAGDMGWMGLKGLRGDGGETGPKGLPGLPGPAGPDGEEGFIGRPGNPGRPGMSGLKGDADMCSTVC